MLGVAVMMSYLFYIKDYYNKLKANPATAKNYEGLFKNIPFWVTLLSSLLVQVFSFIYGKVILKLTDWENHEKISKYDRSFSIKKVLFEFVNNYGPLYYIAFFKVCTGPCWEELRKQLYMNLLVIFALNSVELGVP